MSPKHSLKLLRWQIRRAVTALRWGLDKLNEMPAVLGNAMPKSGSHLIIQVLQGLPRLGPFVNPGFPPVNRSESNTKLPDAIILQNIRRMRPGDIGYGYIPAKEPFLSALTAKEAGASPPLTGSIETSHPLSKGAGGFSARATIFIYRDPRDVIVSHVFYATQMHAGHGMHRYYTETLSSMEERINAAIQGVQEPGSELSSIRNKYAAYLDWLDQPEVLCLRFEDLILARNTTLGRLLDYLDQRGFKPDVPREQAIQVLDQAVMPRKSGTFRKGKPGNWREHFTPANKTCFKELTGDLLIRLGYEENDLW